MHRIGTHSRDDMKSSTRATAQTTGVGLSQGKHGPLIEFDALELERTFFANVNKSLDEIESFLDGVAKGLIEKYFGFLPEETKDLLFHTYRATMTVRDIRAIGRLLRSPGTTHKLGDYWDGITFGLPFSAEDASLLAKDLEDWIEAHLPSDSTETPTYSEDFERFYEENIAVENRETERDIYDYILEKIIDESEHGNFGDFDERHKGLRVEASAAATRVRIVDRSAGERHMAETGRDDRSGGFDRGAIDRGPRGDFNVRETTSRTA